MTWLGYEDRDGEQLIGTGAEPELGGRCWEAARCPRPFAYPPEWHETLLGRWPLASRWARHVLQKVRPWIEPAQSFERNQLGLGQGLWNSLRFTWAMALLADAARLLRARDPQARPVSPLLLADLMPGQLWLELDTEAPMEISPTHEANRPNPQRNQRFVPWLSQHPLIGA